MAVPSFCTLCTRTVLEITGAEAENFLQGLITNDISRVDQSHAVYAALLTPQGKILFDFFISQPQPKIFWLECSLDQSADLIKRLMFYKLRADVEIKPLPDNYQVACIWGDGADRLFANGAAGTAGSLMGGFGYIDPRTAQAGVRLIAKAEVLAQETKTTSLNVVDAAAYTEHRVKLGLADSDADIGSSQRFPHECNLDMTNGVDFSKGCYVGQEVVSRMHHKQAARKRILAISSKQPLTAGTAILAGEKSIGEVLTSTGMHALAAIRLDRADAAIAVDDPLTVAGAPITLIKSDWVRFIFPGEKNGD